MDQTNEELAELAKQGERTAFGRLYDSFFDSIYRYACYHGCDKDCAEDVTSQTFMKALDRIRQFDTRRGNFPAWLYAIARNCVMDHFRAKGRVICVDLSEIPSADCAEDRAVSNERAIRIAKALGKLPVNQREVVMFRVWDDKSYEEISSILGRSPDSCKMAFSRAMAFLRTRLPPILLAFALFQQIIRSVS